MTLYKNQLPSTAMSFVEFIQERNEDLLTNAFIALSKYENGLPNEYDDYLVFFVTYNRNNQAVFAITKIIDEWQPIEVNDRIRKFTEERVYPFDSHVHLKFE